MLILLRLNTVTFILALGTRTHTRTPTNRSALRTLPPEVLEAAEAGGADVGGAELASLADGSCYGGSVVGERRSAMSTAAPSTSQVELYT